MKKYILLLGFFIVISVYAEEVELLNETFATSFGSFTLDEQPYQGCTYASVWYIKTDYGCAYINVNGNTGSRGASDCKLVSPAIDCSDMKEVLLSFSHSTYSGSSSDDDYLFLEVTKDGSTWTTLTIPNWPASKWQWTPCGVDLTAYKSSKMQFRFRYTSADSYAPAWEVKSVVVYGEQEDEEEDEDEEHTCYYPELKGLCGSYLLDSLHSLISDHTVLAYSAVRADKAKVDVVNNEVVDMYSGCRFSVSDYCGYDEEEIECNCYNREHMLPKSWWGGSEDEPMYTDLHHIIPTDFVANTNRSAWVYDEVLSPTWSNSLGSKLGTGTNFGVTAFEPVDEYKGDVARTYFYMITCYKDADFTQGGQGWRYFQSGTAQLNNTALNLLLKWHRSDSVSTKEKTRNDKVAKVQGNRNPFVDSPELVEYIWGTMKKKGYTCEGTIIKPDTIILDDALSCKQARDSALSLSIGATGSVEYDVLGYVTQANTYDGSYGQQSFWMADTQGQDRTFRAYQCYSKDTVYVGDQVLVTGYLYNYNGTPEILRGQTRIVKRGERTANEMILQDVESWLDIKAVYTTMGVNVSSSLNDLPAGIYLIYNGHSYKKVLVK